ncbi:hypothetical protein MUP37_07890, partial [Candidatus Bathyarchaeota archaeon]|nr:hypothetical protein [Candidatus Bathyarchaeota archaeon]
FYYPRNGPYYLIGAVTFSVVKTSTPREYIVRISVPNVSFVNGYPQRTLPSGSIFTLDFVASPKSRMTLYYGPLWPSRVDLFQ